MLPPLFSPPTRESRIGNRARSRPLIPRRDRCQKAILLQSFRHRCRRSLWLARRIRLNEPLRRSPPRGPEIHAAGDPLLPFSLSILRRSDELDKHGVPTSSISLWLRRIDPVKARSQRDVRRAEIRELSEKKNRRRRQPTPARLRVANPRQGDFAKPDCKIRGECPAPRLSGQTRSTKKGSKRLKLNLSTRRVPLRVTLALPLVRSCCAVLRGDRRGALAPPIARP